MDKGDGSGRLRRSSRGLLEQRKCDDEGIRVLRIVAENYPALFRIARHFTHSDAVADHVVQRSLLELLQVCHEIDKADLAAAVMKKLGEVLSGEVWSKMSDIEQAARLAIRFAVRTLTSRERRVLAAWLNDDDDSPWGEHDEKLLTKVQGQLRSRLFPFSELLDRLPVARQWELIYKILCE